MHTHTCGDAGGVWHTYGTSREIVCPVSAWRFLTTVIPARGLLTRGRGTRAGACAGEGPHRTSMADEAERDERKKRKQPGGEPEGREDNVDDEAEQARADEEEDDDISRAIQEKRERENSRLRCAVSQRTCRVSSPPDSPPCPARQRGLRRVHPRRVGRADPAVRALQAFDVPARGHEAADAAGRRHVLREGPHHARHHRQDVCRRGGRGVAGADDGRRRVHSRAPGPRATVACVASGRGLGRGGTTQARATGVGEGAALTRALTSRDRRRRVGPDPAAPSARRVRCPPAAASPRRLRPRLRVGRLPRVAPLPCPPPLHPSPNPQPRPLRQVPRDAGVWRRAVEYQVHSPALLATGRGALRTLRRNGPAPPCLVRLCRHCARDRE